MYDAKNALRLYVSQCLTGIIILLCESWRPSALRDKMQQVVVGKNI